MPIAILVPNATPSDPDSNIASGLFTDIDEEVSNADGNSILSVQGEWIKVVNPDGDIFFPLTNLPGSATSITSVLIRTRARVINAVDDTATYLFDADTIMTGSTSYDDTDSAYADRSQALTGSPTVAQVNAMQIRARQTAFAQTKGNDKMILETDAIELEVDYVEGAPSASGISEDTIDVQEITDAESARNAIASSIFSGLATGTGTKSVSLVAQSIVDLVDTVAAAQVEAHSGVAALLLDVFGLTDTTPGKTAVTGSVISLMADSAGEGNRKAVALAVFNLLASTVGSIDPASPTGTASSIIDFLSLALQNAGRIGAAQSLMDLVADVSAAADRRGAAQSSVDLAADSIMAAHRRGAGSSSITSLEITQGSGAHSGVADERVGLRITTDFFAGEAAVTIHCIPLAGVFDITHNLVGRM